MPSLHQPPAYVRKKYKILYEGLSLKVVRAKRLHSRAELRCHNNIIPRFSINTPTSHGASLSSLGPSLPPYLCVGQPDCDGGVGENLLERLLVSGGGVNQEELWLTLEKNLDVLFHGLTHQELHELVLGRGGGGGGRGGAVNQ